MTRHPTPDPTADTAGGRFKLSLKLTDDEGFFAACLARDRDACELTPEAQAAALGLKVEGLAGLALCRTPRAGEGEHDADLSQVAAYAGVSVPALERLLVGVPGPGVQLSARALRHVDAEGVRTLDKAIRRRHEGAEAPPLTPDEVAVVYVGIGLRQADAGDVGSGVWVGDRPAEDIIPELDREERRCRVTDPERENATPQDGDRARARHAAKSRFCLYDPTGTTIDGLTVDEFLARERLRQVADCDQPVIVDGDRPPQPPAPPDQHRP